MSDYRNDPDFDIEPVPGLPEALPRGESILWQGRPDTWALARSSLWLTPVAVYFALLAVWRVAVSSIEMGWAALPLGVPFVLLGAGACGLILGIAWIQARATVYTITTARVAMRVGAALTLTLNLPFAKIAAADMAPAPGGTGTIALTTGGDATLSYAVLWPHVRPWHMRHVKPALRCVPDPERVAEILAEAVEDHAAAPRIEPLAIAAE